MAIKKKQVLTIDLSKDTNVDYSASKKTALNLSGIENLDEFDVTTDGSKLYFKKGGNTIATISKFTGLKYSKLSSESKYTTDLISGMVEYTGTHTISSKKKVTGTNYNDTFNYTTYEPASLEDITNKRGLTINAGKGNDIITGSKYTDKITGGAGVNVINLSTTNKFGDDEVVLTKGEKLIFKLDTNVANCTDDFDGYVTNEIVGNDLKLTVYNENGYTENNHNGTVMGTVTVKNYAKKDTQTSTGSLFIMDSDENPETVYDIRNKHWKDTYMDETHYNKSKFTGTWVNDFVSAQDFVAKDKKGNAITEENTSREKLNKTKGVTIVAGGAANHNTLDGSIYADTIKGGAGNDYIDGYRGDDTITAGKGNNYIYQYKGEGNDTVYLTKGENTKICMYKNRYNIYESIYNLKFEYVNKNKDLKIYYLDDSGKEAGSVTLKNFAKKDVTNNTTKNTEDSSSVLMRVDIDGNRATLDLRTGNYVYDGDDTIHNRILYTKETSKNYTGTWLNDEIVASDAHLTKTIGKGKNKQVVDKVESDKGLTLKGGGGDDDIYGTMYSDTIDGGAGDDELLGGKGNDTIKGGKGDDYLEGQEGNDKLYGGAGNDWLWGDDGNDILNGDAGNDTLYGGNGDDILKGGAGDDTIYGGNGDDKMYGEKGNNTFVINTNDGIDTIYSGKGTDTIKFAELTDQALLSFEQVKNAKGKLTNDLKIYYTFDKKSYVVVKDYFKKKKGKYTTSVKNILFKGSSTPVSIQDAIIASIDEDAFKDVLYNKIDSTSDLTVNSSTEGIDVSKIKYVATGSGNDNIALDSASNALQILAGEGNNTVSIKNGKDNLIFTGSGNDTITTGDGKDRISAGDGDNIISSGNGNDTIEAGDGSNTITSGSGQKTITVGDSTAEDNHGSTITLTGNISYSDITTGTGDDTITLQGNSGSSVSIESKGGDNTINYLKDYSINPYGTYSEIKTGDGDDTLNMGTLCSNEINLGDGDNTINMKGRDNTINTGSGNDEINVTTQYGSMNTIDAGDGENTITSERADGYDITTGKDKDIITLGTVSGSSGNTVRAGDGDNEISLLNGAKGNIYTGSGNDTIITGNLSNNTIDAGSGENTVTTGYLSESKITVGDGNDTITTGYLNSSTITAGNGNDTITTEGVYSSSSIQAGDGENTITTGYISGTVTAGKDKDTLTSEYLQNATINLGDGNNEFTSYGSSSYGSTITTGTGDDTIDIRGAGSENIINAGSGKNTIKYATAISGYYGSTDSVITTGDGDDTITVGNTDGGGYVDGLTINAGGGTNIINASDDSRGFTVTTEGNNKQTITFGSNTYENNITTYGGDDEIKIAEGQQNAHDNVINAGEGNNTIVIGSQAGGYNYTYKNTVTTGSGDDTITLGNNTYGSEYKNIINAGDGHNIISSGKGGVEITVGNSTVTDTSNPNYNIGSEINVGVADENISGSKITAGSGNDTIRLTGYSTNSTIDAGEGNNTIEYDKDGTNSAYRTKIITGSGNDTITTGENGDLSIYAGNGDNTIVAKGYSVTVETGAGKDNITLGNEANGLDCEWYGYINIGHAEREAVYDEENELVSEAQAAQEGGMENTVKVNNIIGAEVNIYNSYKEDGKHNTINLVNSYGSKINVTGGHTNIDLGFDEELYDYSFGSENTITTGSGDDNIVNFEYSNEINAGDGNNTITMAEAQGSSNEITTGSGNDTITIYGGSDISAGGGDDIVNINTVASEKYHGDAEYRGNYNTGITLDAGNDTVNIDGDYKGHLTFQFNSGDGASNVVNGWHEGVSFKIITEPSCDCFIRSKSGEPTSMEVVLIKDGVETGDILTIKNIYKSDGSEFVDYIQDNHWSYYINGKYITNIPNSIINQNKQTVGNIPGTEKDDIIYGSDGDDIITPKDGTDVIRPYKGDDVIDIEGITNGEKHVHFYKGDGNLTIKNLEYYSSMNYYIEDLADESTLVEKHGADLYIVRENGETLKIEGIYKDEGGEDDGDVNVYNNSQHFYDKEGKSYGYAGHDWYTFYNQQSLRKPVHIYGNENGILVADKYADTNIFHTDDNTNKIVINDNNYSYTLNSYSRENIIYGQSPKTPASVEVDMSWCPDPNHCVWEREGDDLVVKAIRNAELDPRDYENPKENMWEYWNMTTTRVVDFFKEYNTVNTFGFGSGRYDYTEIAAEAMTLQVNSTTDDGETMVTPVNNDWWLNSYTYNAGAGDDTIYAYGNCDIVYGNDGDDIISAYESYPDDAQGYSGLFVGGEGQNTYIISSQPYGEHTIVTTSGQDELHILETIDTGFVVTNTDNVIASADGDDVVISSTDSILGNQRFRIKDALIREIDLAITDDAGREITLKELMETNNIYVASAEKTGSPTMLGSDNNDYIVGLDDITTIKGGKGSDNITAYGNATVFTYGGDPNNITSEASFKDNGDDSYPPYHPIDKVYLYGVENTVYAQSETNYITSYNRTQVYDDDLDEWIEVNQDHYYAYLDQTTVIDDIGGTDTLTLMNTYDTSDGQYKPGGMLNTYIMCDVDKNYTVNNRGVESFDVYLFNNANRIQWEQGNEANFIKINYNEIENISTSDGHTITSENLAVLAEATAAWMASKDCYNISEVIEENLGDTLFEYVQAYAAENNLWS